MAGGEGIAGGDGIVGTVTVPPPSPGEVVGSSGERLDDGGGVVVVSSAEVAEVGGVVVVVSDPESSPLQPVTSTPVAIPVARASSAEFGITRRVVMSPVVTRRYRS